MVCLYKFIFCSSFSLVEGSPVCVLQAQPTCHHKIKRNDMYMNCASSFVGYGDEGKGGGGGSGR